MPQPAEPTNAQMESAFVAMRQPGWPHSLLDLRLAVARYGCVLAAARHLAEGGQITKLDLSGPLTPHAAPLPAQQPARRAPGTEPRPLLPARRSSDHHHPHHHAHDGKALAAGERPDQEP